MFLTRTYEDEQITVHFSIADFNSDMEGEEEDGGYGEEDLAMGDEEGAANTKGAINKGSKPDGNFKIAPEDAVAPADREDLADDVSTSIVYAQVGGKWMC